MDTLLYERNSAFNHKLWSRYEYLKLYAISLSMQKEHEAGYIEMGYSLVQDAFYALQGEQPNASPVGQKWGEVVNQDYFPTLLEEMRKGRDAQINTTLLLARKFKEHYIEPPPPEKKGKGKGKNSSEKPPDAPQEHSDSVQNPSPDLPDEVAEALADLTQQSAEGVGDTDANEQAGPQFGAQLSNSKSPMSVTQEDIDQLQKDNEACEIMGGLLGGAGAGPRETRMFVEETFDDLALRRVADIVGWGERIMQGAARQNQGAVGEMTGFKMDSWTPNVHPLDRSQVTSGSLLGMAKLADSQLNTRMFDEEKPQGKGAAVVLTDESSSMIDNYQDRSKTKHVQAQNLQLALAHIFQEQGRPFMNIAWDDGNTRSYEYGKPGLPEHLNTFFGGGTAVSKALEEALDWIDTKPEYRNQADIMVISDGELNYNDNPGGNPFIMKKVDEFKKRGGRIWFVWVGYTGNDTKLKAWVDMYLSVDDFYGGEGMEKVLANIATDRTEYESTLV